MKNLITSIASIILFTICFLQFAADLNTYVTITRVNDTIEGYRGAYESENVKAKIEKELDEIHNVEDAEVITGEKELKVTYYITHIIGPDKIININENENKRKFERDVYWETSQ